ncbi:DUF2066 domain-containing protein [Mesorhizobium sp. 1M-11]|uniref:DUF2066 domain-containing protein n=1 Tax=Mesorhizobium sp. 1M-11 TaxID=1529006 RepID=UPI0006C74873|nr:DUF2066 domain-containing protein [Mesorhizobium sp. 1M-11]
MFGGLKSGIVAAALAMAVSASAAEVNRTNLYRGQSVTNGFGEVNRARALAPSLEDVLVKVSGDPRLIGDPRVAEMARHAPDYLKAFSYRDLLNNRPPHDEQGTYDRPQYLTADFDPDKINALLASLGRKPWPLPRPKIVALIEAAPMKGDSFMLANKSDNHLAADMRAALLAAAEQTGMPLQLPARYKADAIRTEKSKPEVLAKRAKTLGGDLLLVGTMVWREEALGWVADWHLVSKSQDRHWQLRGFGFDDTFRNALRGAAQILSGNGQPEAVVTAK